MHVLIDISEELYQLCRSCLGDGDCIERTIANGIPIPKNHGDLKDVDRLESHDEYDGQGFTKSVYQDDIDNLPTIIESDNESEEV